MDTPKTIQEALKDPSWKKAVQEKCVLCTKWELGACGATSWKENSRLQMGIHDEIQIWWNCWQIQGSTCC